MDEADGCCLRLLPAVSSLNLTPPTCADMAARPFEGAMTMPTRCSLMCVCVTCAASTSARNAKEAPPFPSKEKSNDFYFSSSRCRLGGHTPPHGGPYLRTWRESYLAGVMTRGLNIDKVAHYKGLQEADPAAARPAWMPPKSDGQDAGAGACLCVGADGQPVEVTLQVRGG
jgi:hypothetical protein